MQLAGVCVYISARTWDREFASSECLKIALALGGITRSFKRLKYSCLLVNLLFVFL